MSFPYWYPQAGDIVYNNRWQETWLVLTVEKTSTGDAFFSAYCFASHKNENWTWRGNNIRPQDLEYDWTLIRNGDVVFGKNPLPSSCDLL